MDTSLIGRAQKLVKNRVPIAGSALMQYGMMLQHFSSAKFINKWDALNYKTRLVTMACLGLCRAIHTKQTGIKGIVGSEVGIRVAK